MKSEESLYAAVGFGDISPISVFNKLTEKERREEERAKAKAEAEELVKGGEVKHENKDVLKVRSENGVIIQGASGLLMRIAKCCNPVPGDPIDGYITKGRGIAIHRSDCHNIKSQDGYQERLIEVEWDLDNSVKIIRLKLISMGSIVVACLMMCSKFYQTQPRAYRQSMLSRPRT